MIKQSSAKTANGPQQRVEIEPRCCESGTISYLGFAISWLDGKIFGTMCA
jgi:hypothetical protein